MQSVIAQNMPQFGVSLEADDSKNKIMKTKKTGKLANSSDLKPQ
jgi:hypothetical protein